MSWLRDMSGVLRGHFIAKLNKLNGSVRAVFKKIVMIRPAVKHGGGKTHNTDEAV